MDYVRFMEGEILMLRDEKKKLTAEVLHCQSQRMALEQQLAGCNEATAEHGQAYAEMRSKHDILADERDTWQKRNWTLFINGALIGAVIGAAGSVAIFFAVRYLL